MIIGFDPGHNLPPDTGAKGIRKEDELIMEVMEVTKKILEKSGIKIVDCLPKQVSTVKESLRSRCDIANRNNLDLGVSFHFNAFNGRAGGTEVFAVSSTAKSYANSVVREICKLGFDNRGVKNGSHLFVIRNTKAPWILIESCFCDSKKDMDLYKAEEIGSAIATGLLNPAPINSLIPEREIFPELKCNHAEGVKVSRLQARFGLPQDGFYDNALETKVKEFQEEREIFPSGIVDQWLWNQIFPSDYF